MLSRWFRAWDDGLDIPRRLWTLADVRSWFDYFDILHNRKRAHSGLGMLTPIWFEYATPVA